MKYKELTDLLDSIIALLDNYAVYDWHSIISEKKQQLVKAIELGKSPWIIAQLEELMEIYGGMGSFTDLFITNQTGHNIPPEKISQENRKLHTLQTELYTTLKKEISRLQKQE